MSMNQSPYLPGLGSAQPPAPGSGLPPAAPAPAPAEAGGTRPPSRRRRLLSPKVVGGALTALVLLFPAGELVWKVVWGPDDPNFLVEPGPDRTQGLCLDNSASVD